MGMLPRWSLLDLRSELEGEKWSGKPALAVPSTPMTDIDNGS